MTFGIVYRDFSHYGIDCRNAKTPGPRCRNRLCEFRSIEEEPLVDAPRHGRGKVVAELGYRPPRSVYPAIPQRTVWVFALWTVTPLHACVAGHRRTPRRATYLCCTVLVLHQAVTIAIAVDIAGFGDELVSD